MANILRSNWIEDPLFNLLGIVLGVGLFAAFALPFRQKAPVKKDDEWTTLYPRIVVLVLSYLSTLISIGLAAFSMWVLVFEATIDLIMVLTLTILIGAATIFLYVPSKILLNRVRFNESGIEFNSLLVKRFVQWNEIKVIDSGWLGVKVVHGDSSIVISPYFVGVPELLFAAKNKCVAVKPDLIKEFLTDLE